MAILPANEKNIQRAARIIKTGGVVAFPTETVYGLGANAFNVKAIRSIYKLKGRPTDNPLIVHIVNRKDARSLARTLPDEAEMLAKCFWPGPLTLVTKKHASVPSIVTAGNDTVAIRMPRSRSARALIRTSGTPIAAPSANKAGRPSATSPIDVQEDFGKDLFILDGGRSHIGLESTVLDITRKPFRILRPGAITRKEIEHCIKAPVRQARQSVQRPTSPGMKYRHYAPKGKVVFIKNVRDALKKIKLLEAAEKHVCVIVHDEHASRYPIDLIVALGSKKNTKQIARNLYRALRACDQKRADVVFIEPVSERGLGHAIMNRLKKAAER